MDLRREGKAVPKYELRWNGNEKRGSAVAGMRPGLRRNGKDMISKAHMRWNSIERRSAAAELHEYERRCYGTE